MKKYKLALLFGTRPEAIKMASLIVELKKDPRVELFVVSTGQHREMMRPILDFFQIQLDLDLDLMRPGQSLVDITLGVQQNLEARVGHIPWDGLLVQGDTASCMAGALWAYLKRIPVFHIEAGLRTGDLNSPWPEEFNRRVTGLATHLHFPPTSLAAQNLLREGFPREQVFTVGNTVIDALLQVSQKLNQDAHLQQRLAQDLPALKTTKKLILATVHRRESFGEGIREIFSALKELADDPANEVVLPLHLNPQVQAAAGDVLKNSKVQLIPPQSYVPFVALMNRADLILSDSGGVQEEAPSLGKPVLVLRATTERPEAILAGACRLVGTNKECILAEAKKVLKTSDLRKERAPKAHPYGDGTASQKIKTHIKEFLDTRST